MLSASVRMPEISLGQRALFLVALLALVVALCVAQIAANYLVQHGVLPAGQMCWVGYDHCQVYYVHPSDVVARERLVRNST